MVIFHSYVSLPEGNHSHLRIAVKKNLNPNGYILSYSFDRKGHPFGVRIHRGSALPARLQGGPEKDHEVISSPGQLSFMDVYEFMMLYNAICIYIYILCTYRE